MAMGDIHDCIDRIMILFGLIDEYLSVPRYILFTGDFGEDVSTLKFLGEILEKRSIIGISTYGNHEPEIIRKIHRSQNIECIYGIKIIPLGKTYEVGDIKILSIGGNRGSGKKWSHWRDHEVLEIIRQQKNQKIDIVLAHEMPFGLADRCRGNKNCGQIALRELIEKLEPRIYLGGHLHTHPSVTKYKETYIVKVGGISNRGYLKNKSFFATLEISNTIKIESYCVDIEKREISLVLKEQ